MASIDGRSIGSTLSIEKISCWRSVEYCTHRTLTRAQLWRLAAPQLPTRGRAAGAEGREACLQRDGRASAAQHGHDELREALRRERSAQRGQLVERTPKRPHVRLVVVRPREAELGAHVQRRADDRVRELARLHQSSLVCHTERGV
jgi:hypothetical protein